MTKCVGEAKPNRSKAFRTSETIAEKQGERGGSIWQSRSKQIVTFSPLWLITMCLIYFISLGTTLFAEDVIGFWKSYDEKTGKPQVIVAIYEYRQKYYGRIIGSFNDDGVVADSIHAPVSRTHRLVGNPFYSGMDIIWNLQKRGSKFTGGEILDPKRGKVYNVELWRRGDNLIIRGKLLFFGRNLTWYPVSDADLPQGFVKPDLAHLTPVIPQIK